MRQAAALGFWLVAVSCSYDWNALDPRLAGDATGATAGQAPSAGSGGATGGTGASAGTSSGGAGAAAGTAGSAGSASGGTAGAAGSGGALAGAGGAQAGSGGSSGSGGSAGTGCTGPGEFAWPTSGSCYRFVDAPTLDWNGALADCETWGGTLAAITSTEENDFVATRVSDATWIGGGDAVREGRWEWATGEIWSFESWETGEPNSSGDCVQLWFIASPTLSAPTWDDLACDQVQAYLCER